MNHLLRLLASAWRLFPLRPRIFPSHSSGRIFPLFWPKTYPVFRGQDMCVHGTLPWQNMNQNPGSGRGPKKACLYFVFSVKSLPEFCSIFLFPLSEPGGGYRKCWIVSIRKDPHVLRPIPWAPSFMCLCPGHPSIHPSIHPFIHLCPHSFESRINQLHLSSTQLIFGKQSAVNQLLWQLGQRVMAWTLPLSFDPSFHARSAD